MHTSELKNEGRPRVWLIHNADFSGEAFVRWSYVGSIRSYEWKVEDGRDLLSGDLPHQPFYQNDDDVPVPVPYWVIGRAVSLATDRYITNRIINFIESDK